jgi:translation initiation factor 2B subunit (eIF-2B alpha/beta/delta family)
VEGVPDEIIGRIEALRGNNTSGASELLADVISILSAARAARADLPRVAEAVCTAQPTMAPVWNAARAALSPVPDAFDHFIQRVRRAPAALARYTAAHFREDDSGRAVRIVTLSYSSSVVVAINAIRATRVLHVSCSESRPAQEGRRLAADLVAVGTSVDFFTDAAIAHALDSADAVIVGADAVGPTWFLNKCGTRMLAAAATQQGVPVYVVATRDKFVGHQLAGRLLVRSGDAREVWDVAPPGVAVRNPYFESTPLELITSVISDIGMLGTGMVAEVCASMDEVS